jgi:hydroxyacylglutathione hydrolase
MNDEPISQRPTKLRLRGMTLGDYQTNAYIAWVEDPAAAEGQRTPCWIFDAPGNPGEEADGASEIAQLIDSLNDLRLEPTLILLTHCHLDHIAGLTQLRSAFPKASVRVHERERDWLTDPVKNLSAFSGQPVTAPPLDATKGDATVADGDELVMPAPKGTQPAPTDLVWRVLHVPGHSPGSVAYFCPTAGLVIGGDALFAGSIGRTDFPNCSHQQLIASIRSKLLTLPPETRLFPGHGPSTTIADEARSNPFLNT